MEATGKGETESVAASTTRGFRIILVVLLILLTVQGWTGDTVNIFFAPPSGVTPPPAGLGGFSAAVQSLGSILVWHAVQGLLLLALAIAIAFLSFRWSKTRSVRLCAILGLFFVLSAGIGGYLFVTSGFLAGGSSAQMGGSYIGSYAFYFMTLYYAK